MAAIRNITWKTVIRPMWTTFATSLGSKTCATSVIVTVTCKNASVGMGEVPTSFILPHENVQAIQTVLSETKTLLLDKPVGDYAALTARLRKQYPDFHMTISGLEVALYRAHLAAENKIECPFRSIVQTDITIPFVPQPPVLEPWIKKAIGNKFQAYKVKVSGNVGRDIKFCKAIHKILTESGTPFTIRLDGNQGFTSTSAMELIEKLDRISIDAELFEQPLKYNDYRGMDVLFKKSPIPIIADETVFCADDCRRVINNGLAHGVNIKIAKSGISESLKILQLAKRAGLKLMIGCMTETMVGLSAGIYLAAETAVFDYIDLDSIHFLHHRKRYGNITIRKACYEISKIGGKCH
jgi:L-alanine-DL-glutamate epimerase-like enolase superfamily enzyme